MVPICRQCYQDSGCKLYTIDNVWLLKLLQHTHYFWATKLSWLRKIREHLEALTNAERSVQIFRRYINTAHASYVSHYITYFSVHEPNPLCLLDGLFIQLRLRTLSQPQDNSELTSALSVHHRSRHRCSANSNGEFFLGGWISLERDEPTW